MKLLPPVTLLVLIVLAALKTDAQETPFAGSKYQALGNASVGLGGCWSVFGNQAGLAGIGHPEIGGSFHNRFLVEELSSRSGWFVFPVQSSVFAFSLYQFGEIPFRQDKFGLSYARRIFPKLSFGLQFNYYRLFLSEDNRSASSSGLELGLQYLVTSRLVLGAHVLNPYQTSIKTYSGNFRYPSRLNVGAFCRLSDTFSLTSDLENDFNRHFRLKTGMEYTVLEKLWIRVGVSGKPYEFSAGIGFQVKKLTLDLASSYHQYLGNSPSVSFQYQF